MPADLAGRIAALQDLVAAPDIALVAQRTGRAGGRDRAQRISRVEAIFQLGALSGAAREIPVSDYFDRLALDRASMRSPLPIASSPPRSPRKGSPASLRSRPGARRAASRSSRIRAAVDSIVASGLTLSKLTVAASLLGDLAKE